MTDGFIDMLRSWQNFYFMIGGASAALAGLMFVALSLGQHLITRASKDSFETFTEPSIYYFVTVLLIGAVMLIPAFTPVSFLWVVLISGLLMLARTSHHAVLLTRTALKYGDFNLGDWMGQLILPVLGYTLIPAAGLCFLAGWWALGFLLIAIGTLLILVAGILNTWGIVIWIIYQQKESE